MSTSTVCRDDAKNDSDWNYDVSRRIGRIESFGFILTTFCIIIVSKNTWTQIQHIQTPHGKNDDPLLSLQKTQNNLLKKLAEMEKEIAESNIMITKLDLELSTLEKKTSLDSITLADHSKRIETIEGDMSFKREGLNDSYSERFYHYFNGQNQLTSAPVTMNESQRDIDVVIQEVAGSDVNSQVTRRLQESASPSQDTKSGNLSNSSAPISSDAVTSFNILNTESVQDPCSTGAFILSPYSAQNNFEYDEKMDHIISLVRGVSSGESLLRSGSPQLQAACWLLVHSSDSMDVTGHLLQFYVLSVLFFSILNMDAFGLTLVDSLTTDECLVPGIECNDNGSVVKIDLCKYYTASIHLCFDHLYMTFNANFLTLIANHSHQPTYLPL